MQIATKMGCRLRRLEQCDGNCIFVSQKKSFVVVLLEFDEFLSSDDKKVRRESFDRCPPATTQRNSST